MSSTRSKCHLIIIQPKKKKKSVILLSKVCFFLQNSSVLTCQLPLGSLNARQYSISSWYNEVGCSSDNPPKVDNLGYGPKPIKNWATNKVAHILNLVMSCRFGSSPFSFNLNFGNLGSKIKKKMAHILLRPLLFCWAFNIRDKLCNA